MPASPRVSAARIVAPFGFYGAGNIGDEATLHGFARLLEETNIKVRVTMGSRNPGHTARVEPAFRYFNPAGFDPRRMFAKVRATAHAVVGGTPIMDVLGDWPLRELTPLVKAIDKWKVPLTFVGVGIESLREESSRQIVSREYTPRVAHWSVRTDRCRQRLLSFGVSNERITVASDMAWLIKPATADYGRAQLQQLGIDPAARVIGVNLANENSVFDRNPAMVAAISSALDQLIEEYDARVVFLANDVRGDATFDQAASRMVTAGMRHAARAVVASSIYFSPRQMMSIVACCKLTLTMRYHFCIFSVLQGVPFIAIQRSDKVGDLTWDLGWSASLMPPDFTAADLLGHAHQFLRNEAANSKTLPALVEKMKTRALLNTSALDPLL